MPFKKRDEVEILEDFRLNTDACSRNFFKILLSFYIIIPLVPGILFRFILMAIIYLKSFLRDLVYLLVFFL